MKTVYQCDVCNRVFNSKEDAERCEFYCKNPKPVIPIYPVYPYYPEYPIYPWYEKNKFWWVYPCVTTTSTTLLLNT